MVICYEIICSTKQIEDYGLCHVYGLAAYETGNRNDKYACCIEDISTNEQFIQQLYDLVRSREVHPVHLKDVIMDFIG